MHAIESMLTRNSIPAKLLTEPAPTEAELQQILATAMRAPDHAGLRPWRFFVIRDEARKRLGELFAAALCERDPLYSADQRAKELGRPLRSPLIVAVCAEVVENHPKAPRVEQVGAVAMACQNMLNAAHAMGFGAIMLTGANATDPMVKAAFGLSAKDEIVGFLYFGTPAETPRPKSRPEPSAFTKEWTAPLSDRAQAAE